MARTAINVYSVRDLDESTTDVLDRVADAGYDGVQFSGRHTPMNDDPEEIAAKLEETGLDATAAHVGMEALREDREAVLEAYEPVGISAAVVPYLDESHFESVAAVEGTATALNDLAEDLAGIGWDLHYHNHAHEYVDLGGEWAFERFIEETTEDVGIELDVGWALVGGDDPAERIRSLGDRAELIHMKDMDTSVERGFVEIGEGDVDMHACAEAAAEVGSEWLIYEHDDPEDPAATIDAGGEFLNAL